MHSYPLFHAIPFLIYFWPPFFAVVWWAFCLLGVLLFSCLFSGGVLGPVSYACYLFRPALFVLVCWVLCGLCAFFVVFCGVAGLCWPLVVVGFFVPSSVALRVFAFVVWGFGPCSLLASSSPLSCPPPRLVSVLLVPSSGYLVVFATARLSCLWYGVL